MLIDTIQTDLKNAQLDKNELKVSTLRLLLSEIKYAGYYVGGKGLHLIIIVPHISVKESTSRLYPILRVA